MASRELGSLLSRERRRKPQAVISLAVAGLSTIGVISGVLLAGHEDNEVRKGALHGNHMIVQEADQSVFQENIIYTINDARGLPRKAVLNKEKLETLVTAPT